jgi:2-polyprenyl-6-methoxyphenol hydroxylase-like FAD-dependent oxidoreductase
MSQDLHTDVVILGGGLAGLTLARHLLLETDKRVVMVERYRDDEQSRQRQKYGESTVQLSGWYFGKVLDLTEELLKNHYIKYNLRFYWPVLGGDATRFEEYCQSYLTTFSNIATFQLDRNLMEQAVLALNETDPRFSRILPATGLEIELDPRSEHRVSFDGPQGRQTVAAPWLVDASGRNRVLAKKLGLARKSPIQHGASFAWVEGLVDIEKLTDRSLREQRMHPWHRSAGHSPLFLATNHFCDEGLWFWVIPLHDKTSLGLVYDHSVVDFKDVNTGEKLLAWAGERFPCFRHDLPKRKLLGHYGLRDYAHDCQTAISEERWAMTGEAGRFSDPLYSPGSDLIALHNSFIVDAIKHDRRARCRTHEAMARALYDGYVPGYAIGYIPLGDQEAFTLKYVWELTVYFVAYVFPFQNELFTEPSFVGPFLQRFTRLGPWNRGLQELLTGYTRWKKAQGTMGGGGTAGAPALFEFSDFPQLARSRTLMMQVGLTAEQALAELEPHWADLEELARYMAVWVMAGVLGAPEAVTNRAFVESIDMNALRWDLAEMRARWEAARHDPRTHVWSFDPEVMAPLRPVAVMAEAHEAIG